MPDDPSSTENRRGTDAPIKYLGVVISVIALLEGWKVIDEWVTPDEAAALRNDAIVVANLNASVQQLTTRMDAASQNYSKINESLSTFGRDMAVTLANYGLRIESLEQGVKNHWQAPHPDNTQRAIENSQKNIEQDQKINSLDFRVQRVEESNP